MANTLGISKKYLRFFVNNINSRHLVIQGGRRSSKSFSVFKWVHLLASGKPKTVLIVTATFPALQLAISDFQRATGLSVGGNAIYGYSCQLSNGSIFMFRAFDDYSKAQGTTANILVCEEALNIDESIISTLLMSVTDQVFFVFNPTRQCYIDKYIKPDKSNYLITTFKDNPYLTESQLSEFEDMRKRAMSPTASVLDIYQWKVYGEGDFSSMSGKVFKQIHRCTDEEYDSIPAHELFSIDFGFSGTMQSDETAMAGGKIYNGRLYLKEYIYSNQLVNDQDLAMRMANIGLDVYTPCIGDYGALGAQRIRNLVTAGDGTWTDPKICQGFNVSNAVKGKIIDGLRRMLQYDIYVTDSSTNFFVEFDKFELTDQQKPKNGIPDHLIACARYIANSYWVQFGYDRGE